MKKVNIILLFGFGVVPLASQGKAAGPLLAGTMLAAKVIAGEVFDTVTGKPNIWLLELRLKELERTAGLNQEMIEELQKLTEECNKRSVTKAEFQKLSEQVVSELSKIKARLDDVEERVERLEVENEDLKANTQNGKSAAYFAARGDQLVQKGKPERALACFSLALQLDNSCLAAYRGRAGIYQDRQAWLLARETGVAALPHCNTIEKSADSYHFRRLLMLAEAELWQLQTVIINNFAKQPVMSETDSANFESDSRYALVPWPDAKSTASSHYLLGLYWIRQVENLSKLGLEKIPKAEWENTLKMRNELRFRYLADAISNFDKALKADPEQSGVHLGRAAAWLILHKNHWQFQPHKATLAIANPQTRDLLELTQVQITQRAEDDLIEALKRNPKEKQAHLIRAELKLRDPNHLQTREFRLTAAGRAHNSKILADLNAALAIDPNDPHLLRERAFSHFRLEDKASCVADLTRVTELAPNHWLGFYDLSMFIGAQGNTKKSQELAAKSRELMKLHGQE